MDEFLEILKGLMCESLNFECFQYGVFGKLPVVTGNIACPVRISWAEQYTPVEKVAIMGGVLYVIRREGQLLSPHCTAAMLAGGAAKQIEGGFTKRASRQVASVPVIHLPIDPPLPTKSQFSRKVNISNAWTSITQDFIPFIFGDVPLLQIFCLYINREQSVTFQFQNFLV